MINKPQLTIVVIGKLDLALLVHSGQDPTLGNTRQGKIYREGNLITIAN